MVILILEKRDAQVGGEVGAAVLFETYRLTVINSGTPGLDWHACSSVARW